MNIYRTDVCGTFRESAVVMVIRTSLNVHLNFGHKSGMR